MDPLDYESSLVSWGAWKQQYPTHDRQLHFIYAFNHVGENVTLKLSVITNNMFPPCSLNDAGCSAENCFQLWDKYDISVWCSFPSWRCWVMPNGEKMIDSFFFYCLLHSFRNESVCFAVFDTCQKSMCVQSFSRSC